MIIRIKWINICKNGLSKTWHIVSNYVHSSLENPCNRKHQYYCMCVPWDDFGWHEYESRFLIIIKLTYRVCNFSNLGWVVPCNQCNPSWEDPASSRSMHAHESSNPKSVELVGYIVWIKGESLWCGSPGWSLVNRVSLGVRAFPERTCHPLLSTHSTGKMQPNRMQLTYKGQWN